MEIVGHCVLGLRIMIRNSNIDRLRGLFAKRLIATMDMLKKTVGTVADLTVFRKLRELDYCTSYSHRGRFYTLRELAEFDENGLWWIRSVGFSSRGTLVATAEGLVNASEAGYAFAVHECSSSERSRHCDF